ncbi:MurNAc alpha-1-phosphate uridylyltransferase [Natronospira proteinivora]|uniref:MurNAc alpha-1-phosphate uridylyltransferase n=1 Tax=Natronospira proteinivora TaxID=1807133 RepID=A0ABT1GBS8_9GAMM|nr:nucleotidyltransferase family protein [Natronospira proteinivora]MCP1727387.1 MurNAc alpha-1-phosphate uridylyltransferase [Natronospira proteinivora]
MSRRAMVLAAGRGQRMRPLTDQCPKPLLSVAGRPLIEHQIERLAYFGWREIVINLGWLGDQIRTALGDGSRLGVTIRYSEEGWPALETGGGIQRALPLLGSEPFMVVNGDVFCDAPLDGIALAPGDLATLLLVDNPSHNPDGDFGLRAGRVSEQGGQRLTFSGVGVYDPRLFADAPGGAWPLAPRLREAARAGRVGGVHHAGLWLDVGTPERLSELEHRLLRGMSGEEAQ